MKKSIFLAALMLVTGMALTGCKDDTQPRLKPATGEFKLFEPADNNYTYDLTNKSYKLKLTTSGQPDYGVATPTKYQVQVSLTDEWKDAVMDPATGEEAIPATYYSLPTVNTQSIIEASALEINQAITTLQGVYSEEDTDMYDPSARPLYVRVRAYIADPGAENGFVPYSEVISNVIKLNSVQPMATPSIPQPALLYIVGNYQDWAIAGNDKTVAISEAEDGIGSDVYSGYVYMTKTQASSGFRFYFALVADGWGNDGSANGVGSNANDGDNASIELEDNKYEGDIVIGGKGNWNVTNMPEDGWLKLTVDLNTKKIVIEYDPDYTE